MRLNCARDKRLAALVAVVLIIADQLSKLWAQNVIAKMPGKTIPLVDGVISFVFTWNTGAAFSFLQSRPLVVSCLSLVLVLALTAVAFFSKALSLRARLSVSMILAGGVGNLIDRARIGAVIDFINLEFIRFPVFNFADICVCVGAALLIIFLYVPGRREDRVK